MPTVPTSLLSVKPSTFILEPLLPTRELHLIAGGSGSGKSTLACQIASALINGGDFFGIPFERPFKIAYLAFDRSAKGMARTFARTLGTDEIPFPFYSTITSPEFSDSAHRTANGAVQRLLTLHPAIEVLIVDGIGMAFKGDSSSLSEVSSYVHDLIRLLDKLPHDLTIIALHHMGKVKKGNEYAQARQRLHGSVAWAATCETCILIEPESEEDAENPNRKVTICPRNAPERIYTYAFDEDGRLVRAGTVMQAKSAFRQFLDALVALPDGEDIPNAQIETIADTLSIPPTSRKRYLDQMLQDGAIQRVRRGVYQRLGGKLKTIC